MEYKLFSSAQLAALVGVEESDIPDSVSQHLYGNDFNYTKLDGGDHEAVLLDILQLLDTDTLTYSGPHRYGDWEKGWGENLAEFIESGYDLTTLRPKYYGKLRPCRYENAYVLGRTPNFMYAVSNAYSRWLFSKFFQGCESIHEFGCGTGHNLLVLLDMFPTVKLIGYDWAKSSQEILSLAGEMLNIDIRGEHFDFYDSGHAFNLGENAGVLTFGALEQVADRFGPFMERILAAKPKICVHVEGFDEMYDHKTCLMDYLALKYHRKRNYLTGYFSTLQSLADKGEIQIIAAHRIRFGNLFDDPYSYVVWRPLS